MSLLTFARHGLAKRAPYFAAACLFAASAGLAVAAQPEAPRSSFQEVERILQEQHAVLTKLYREGADPDVIQATVRRYEVQATPLLWELSLEERQALKDHIEAEAGALWGLARADS